MALGPMLIFDKSTLQSLSQDESVWLENFFLTNIPPSFLYPKWEIRTRAVKSEPDYFYVNEYLQRLGEKQRLLF